MCYRAKNPKDLYKENRERYIEIDGSCRFNYDHQLRIYDEKRKLVYCRRCDIIYYNPQGSIRKIEIEEDQEILWFTSKLQR